MRDNVGMRNVRDMYHTPHIHGASCRNLGYNIFQLGKMLLCIDRCMYGMSEYNFSGLHAQHTKQRQETVELIRRTAIALNEQCEGILHQVEQHLDE